MPWHLKFWIHSLLPGREKEILAQCSASRIDFGARISWLCSSLAGCLWWNYCLSFLICKMGWRTTYLIRLFRRNKWIHITKYLYQYLARECYVRVFYAPKICVTSICICVRELTHTHTPMKGRHLLEEELEWIGNKVRVSFWRLHLLDCLAFESYECIIFFLNGFLLKFSRFTALY